MNPKELSQFPLGDKNDAFAKYFVGQSYLHMLSTQQIAIAKMCIRDRCYDIWLKQNTICNFNQSLSFMNWSVIK